MSNDHWMQTFTGRAVDLVAPTPEDIDVQDIAVGLSRINRFSGATTCAYPWNVALHSLLAESLMDETEGALTRLIVLLHDAHEAYTGDVTTPLKRALPYFGGHAAEKALHALQSSLDWAIFRAFGVPVGDEGIHQTVKKYDRLALAHEKRFLMADEPQPWMPLPEVPHYAKPPQVFPPSASEHLFRERCKRLVREAGVTPLPTLNLL